MHREPERLRRKRYDVLVVGGGIYGASVARDAVLRGLDVALIERGDFGAETSHNSLKLIHGGIRYIQHLDLARLRASAREQGFWLDAAPKLIRPLEFVIPLHGHGMRGPEAFAAAAGLYNLLTTGLRPNQLRPARTIYRRACAAAMAGLAPPGASGGGIWYDGQMLDANRVLLACLQSAAAAGADLANHLAAVDFLGPPERIEGVVAEDRLTGTGLEIRARLTINCAGPAAAGLVGSARHPVSTAGFGGLARAMNLVVDRQLVPDRAVGIVSKRRSDALLDRGGRMFFLTPWRDKTIIGTAHLPFHGEPDDYQFSEEEIIAFLAEINEAHPSLALTRADVIYCHAGLTPADRDDDDGDVRRRRRGNLIDHQVSDGVDGLLSVVGIKYTTARLIAQRVVDEAFRRLGRPPVPCRSASTPLPDLSPIALPLDDRTMAVRCRAAVRDEMAMRLGDLLLRRTPIGETGSLDETMLVAAADAMAAELSWDRRRREHEIATVRNLLRRHRGPPPAASQVQI